MGEEGAGVQCGGRGQRGDGDGGGDGDGDGDGRGEVRLWAEVCARLQPPGTIDTGSVLAELGSHGNSIRMRVPQNHSGTIIATLALAPFCHVGLPCRLGAVFDCWAWACGCPGTNCQL